MARSFQRKKLKLTSREFASFFFLFFVETRPFVNAIVQSMMVDTDNYFVKPVVLIGRGDGAIRRAVGKGWIRWSWSISRVTSIHMVAI